ncbi:MAG: DNA primase (EC [uncultured Sulfurovum sp.]|uniref:DNA primase (EC) n=1 Tax=uncultured Sulfurovum sp. TaxID=269237 RepID=A0A6S6U6M2_9BACT|nr:MAG: DNA primase (EC [uncultured Sulfurovum sp.]
MKKRQDKTLSYIDKISKEIIEALEKGTAPWIKPWSGSVIRDNAPFNPITGKQYEGINFLNLSLQSMAMNGDPRWMTFKQAQSLKAQVKKGEKGTSIQYWKFTKQIDKLDDDGKKILDANNKPIKVTLRLKNPQVFYATVFNATQIDGLRSLKEDLGIKEVITEFKPIEAAQKILENSNANINHIAGNRAFYKASEDKIQLPLKEQFNSEMNYYSTALHELSHWTGHESRLNRDMRNPFGSMAYAKEELRAEIGSYMLSAKIGIDFDPSQHHAYIDNWVSILEDKPSEIFKASADASKIVSFITALQEEQKEKLEKQEETLEKELDENNKESFSNIMVGAVEQMENNELKLEQLQKSLPALSKNIELEELRLAISKTKETLLKQNINESIKQELQELSSILSNLYQDIEKAETQQQESSLVPKEETLYTHNTYLAVPYQEKEEAKRAGAKWDKNEKSWYAPKGSEINTFKTWSIEQQELKSMTLTGDAITQAISSFKEAIESKGLLLDDEPIMDGKIHRVPVVGDKRGKKSGAYIGYMDGTPAGFIQNYKMGSKDNWKAIGYEFSNGLTQEDYDRQKALNQAKQLERENELNKVHEETALLSQSKFKEAKSSDDTHPYLVTKDVKNYGLKIDEKNNLLMPLQDSEGKHWSNQKINVNFKGFEKHAKKEGNFFIIGEQNLDKTQEMIIVEGYSTGATIHEATGKTVIVAVDSGNLLAVTQALDTKYPNSTILLAADNDKRLELKGKINVGYLKAFEAARNTGRNLTYPSFSNEEIKANHSDFNDLAKTKGLKEVKRIIENSLEKSKILQQRGRELQKEQNQTNQKVRKKEVVRSISVGR